MKIIALLPIALCVSAATKADVLISQYIKGSSNNKAIELYNTSDTPINLKDYTLSFYSNGKTSASTVIDLTGNIEPNRTFVIADQNAVSAITQKANQLSGQNFFNGDDAVVLANGNTVVDSFGQKGFDPGSQWGEGLTSSQNNTLIRLETVGQGDINPEDIFTPASQYRGLENDDFTGLGEHTFAPQDNGGGDNESLEGVCTNCPDLDKVALASDFNAADYYASVQSEIDAGSSETVIRQRLSETLASGHRQLTYSEVWTALTETDEDPANSNNVILFYSNRSLAKSRNGSGAASSNPDNWNREHSWPKSHGFSERNNEAYTDIQHLRATDISVNSSRGSLDFDYSDAPLAEAPENRVDGDSFEPRDAIKGDVARMMMYMDVRYEGNVDVTPDLVLVNYLTASGDAELGKLCTLLQWHESDPVDASELERVNRIYEYQGNRNPVVDNPQWVSMLYSAQVCNNSTPDPVEPEPEPAPQNSAAPLILTAVFDATLPGGVPKGIELLVTSDIDDLSVCGVGSANNGGGSDGQEFTFDAVSASAGDYLYVASESDNFSAFFDFAPDYTTSAVNINGDDAIEVFCDGEVVDIYGDINTDGNGEAWEYTNSFANRIAGSASATFEVGQWNVPGVDTLKNQTTNAGATTPVPVGTFSLSPATLFFSEYVEGGGFNKALELANLGGTDVDLGAYSIQIFANGNTTPNAPIALSGTLGAGEVYVVANNQAANQVVAVADTLTSAISFNGDDAVVLLLNNNIVDSIGQIGVRTEWGSGNTSTKDATLRRQDGITSGDANAYDSFDPATEWNGFAKDTFDDLGLYNNTGGNSGGDNALGACYEDAVLIHAVQGDGFSSPLTGESVIVEAVVSHVTPGLSGFFVQEETADYDGNNNTSEGVFVTGNPGELMVGDVVRLKGLVEEFYGRTQLVAQGEPLVCANASASVTPIDISLPQSFEGEFEAYEGMLVTNQSDWLVNSVFSYARFGEIEVGSERLFTPTQLFEAGTQQASDLANSNALNVLLIDDNSNSGFVPNELLLPGGVMPQNPVRLGDKVTSVTGALDYAFGNFRIQPVSMVNIATENPRTESPQLEEGNLRIASFNVLNLFNGDGEGQGFPTSRGADTFSEYERQQAKIVAAISAMDADIIGLMELENDGFGPLSSIAQLTDALNEATSDNRYAYIDAGVPTIGSDAITSGLLYRTDKVSAVGAAQILSAENSITDENGPLFAFNNRPSLAQKFRFEATGNTFVVDVNHFKSKGSSCREEGEDTLAGNCNVTRTRAAIALTAWLRSTYRDEPAVVLGDLNAYAKEDPIVYLTNTGFTNTVTASQEEPAYSYTFRGALGTLDYQLANQAMTDFLVDATVWHINADEIPGFDYNEERKPDSWLNTLRYRASDHDPVLATYQFALIGDWDGDGDVDIRDSTGLLTALIRRLPIDDSFDINGDGRINTRDVAAIRKLCTRTGCSTGDTPNRQGREGRLSRWGGR